MNILSAKAALLSALATTALSTAAGAQQCPLGANEVLVTNDIAVNTVWTANNRYNLQNQIYVLPGATLTIEAGTVVASTPTANGSGSLAVTRGAQIFVNGTCECPVIMTSTNDVATWVGGDSKTGTWREAANEWGNLTIMGRGYISENALLSNKPSPNANNVAPMEGLVASRPGVGRAPRLVRRRAARAGRPGRRARAEPAPGPGWTPHASAPDRPVRPECSGSPRSHPR